MKLLNTIAVCLFFSLIIMSCGDDDPMDDPAVKGLDGEWKVTSLTVDLTSTISAVGINLSTTSVGNGKDLDYTLNLDNGNFTTMGSYGLELSTTTSSDPIPNVVSQSYTDVSGSGTYTNTDDEITVNGQLFDFEVDGVSFTQMTGPATASYTVDGDVLTVTQDEEMTTSTLGVESIVQMKSESVWARQ